MRRILSLLLLSLAALDGAAVAAEIDVVDGGTVSVTVSQRELTRLAMSDSAGTKLSRVWGVEGQFTVQADDAAGEAFIRPAEGTEVGKAFSFFVRDDAGGVYTLVAAVADVPSRTVILKPPRHARKALGPDAGALPAAAEPRVRAIKALVRDMLVAEDGGAVDNCEQEIVGQVIPVWRETAIRIERRWHCDALMGEVLILENVSGQEMRLDEREFEGLYDDVRAVAIPLHVLPPGYATSILLVRGARP